MPKNELEKKLRADIRALVRADASHDEKRREAIERASELKLAALLPDNWAADGSLKDVRGTWATDEERDSYQDLREALRQAIRETLPEPEDDDGYGPYCWVQDFTDEWVVYEYEGYLFQVTYSRDDAGNIKLGDPVKVRPVTTYVEIEENAKKTGETRTVTRLVEWRKKKAEALKGLERRTFSAEGMELREEGDGSLNLTGHASVTGVWYDMGFYRERIMPGSFKRTLGENPDVQLLVNHGGLPLARTSRAGKPGTMTLDEDDTGLAVDATLDPADPDVEALERKMRRGDVDEMSFAFAVTDQEWNEDFTERTIKAVTIHRGDVSVVGYGANPATVASLRSQAAIDTLRGIGGEGVVNAFIEWRDHTLRPLEERAGKALSAATIEVLTQVLGLIASADDAVDEAQPLLAELMGVPNPDADADGDEEYDEEPAADAGEAGSDERAWEMPDYTTRARQDLDLLALDEAA